jgi:hypothetical protein
MDPVLLTAATALVGAMATDGWQQGRAALVRVWRRARPADVPVIESDLEAVRAEVLAAREAGDQETEDVLVAEWQSRLRRLLAADPVLGAELRRLVDEELGPLLPEDGREQGTVVQNATASGNGRVYQAGRDMYNQQ